MILVVILLIMIPLPIVLLGSLFWMIIDYRFEYKENFHKVLNKKLILKNCNILKDYLVFTFVLWNTALLLFLFSYALCRTKISLSNPYFVNLLPLLLVLLMIIIGLFFGGHHITRKDGLTKDALKNNEFIIFVDNIEDMECKYPDANVMAREYIFYFKNLKKKYYVQYGDYNVTDIGDEYYVVFIIPTKKILIYKKDFYDLDYDVRGRFVENPNLDYYYSK